MNTKIYLLVSFMSSVILTACSSEEKTEENKEATKVEVKTNKKENLNISILLDLSDRIDPSKYANPSMEFYQRDLGYIESISLGFEKHIRSKPIKYIDDQIQVYFEPEPLDAEINGLAKELKMSFTRDNTTKESIQQISSQFTSISQKIYELAIKDKKYVGSDIWGFFKNKVNDYCIKPGHRNMLFILTDGYIFHKDSKFSEQNKTSYLTPELVKSLKLNTSKYKELIEKKGYGFVKANDSLNELEVVVLSINPAKGNPFESDVITSYWMAWLQDMSVKNPVMKPLSAALPSDLDPIIQKYINR
ncbi:hypothetical protein RYH73_11455 [Olivibacter sp. CPCC 100613]|uniref:hypothetical protein n=1 Tax=Olivibacter sp. CPCC 100613 TaxID=3079931 RepID=UPI002FFC9482